MSQSTEEGQEGEWCKQLLLQPIQELHDTTLNTYLISVTFDTSTFSKCTLSNLEGKFVY